MFFQRLEDVIKRLESDKAEAEACLAAWENVSVLRKKDGSEYAQLGKALTGAKLVTKGLVEDADHPYIHVYYSFNGGWSREDSMWAFHYLDELPMDDPRRAPYVRQFVRQTCPKTAEEIREDIAKRVEAKREYVKELEHDLSVAEMAYNNFKEAIYTADKALKEAGSDHLYYVIKDSVSF